MSGRRRAAALLVVLATATGCVGNAPTTADYGGKAAHSAEAAISALQTALLAVQLSRHGKLLGNYREVVVSSAEDDFSSVQEQFDSIQPPDTQRADRIRNRLDDLLVQGSDRLSQLRILERRDADVALTKVASGIPALVGKLSKLAEAAG